MHILDHVAVGRRDCDPDPLALAQSAEQFVEVRPCPLEQVDAGGLEEEHLDVVCFLRAADAGDGELPVHRRSVYGQVVRFL